MKKIKNFNNYLFEKWITNTTDNSTPIYNRDDENNDDENKPSESILKIIAFIEDIGIDHIHHTNSYEINLEKNDLFHRISFYSDLTFDYTEREKNGKTIKLNKIDSSYFREWIIKKYYELEYDNEKDFIKNLDIKNRKAKDFNL